MEAANEIFHYLPENHIVVCMSYHTGIVPQQCEAHLKSLHGRVSVNEHRRIADVVRSINGVAHRAEDVTYPSPDDEPCAYIPVRIEGLRCMAYVAGHQCTYMGTAIRATRDHCAKVHGWVNEQRRGGNARKKFKHASNRL